MASQTAEALGDQGHAQLMQLCWGSGSNQLNLKKVQERVAELLRTIEMLLKEMESRGIHWKSFLDRLSVINNTHTAIVTELRPILRQYTVYPKYVDNPLIEAHVPDMLASRLLPEQVEQEAAWRDALLPPGSSIAPGDAAEVFIPVDQQVAELKDAVGWLTSVSHAIRNAPKDMQPGVLDPKGKMRKDIDALTREISAAAAAAASAREKTGGSLPGQQHGITAEIIGQKRPRPPSGSGQQAAAAAAAGPGVPSAEDVLIAKIMSGELLREEGRGR